MTNRHWLKREVPAWVKEKLISEEEGKALLARYRKGKPGPYKEAFFVMALVCLLGGLGFLGAGLWNGLTQDERFLLALVPLLVSLLSVVSMVLLDRRIPDDPVAVKGIAMPFGASGVLDEVSDSAGSLEKAQRIGKRAQLWGALMEEERLEPAKTWHHRMPVFLRESAAAFHGVSILAAFWMVADSFKLTDDLYVGLSLCGLLLLVLTLVTSSAASGILYMIVSVGVFYTAPVRGWPEFLSWFYMLTALVMLAHLLRERRDRAVVCFSWVWAVGILLLIFWSAGNMLWQTLFFSLAASLTWMAGGAFRSYGVGAAALRFFGGIAVFAVLLEGSYGAVWADVSGSYALWILFLLFLAADAVLIVRMAVKKEWLSILAGLTPFIMAVSAMIAIFESSGALSATVVSIFCAILSVAVIARGVQMDRPMQRWGGVALLAADGVIRVMDSALSLSERGLFFLMIGLLSGVVCFLLYLPSKRKRKVVPAEEEKEDDHAE